MSDTDSPQQSYVPAKRNQADYPLIDNDPHFNRVVRYFRPSDYVAGATMAVLGPSFLFLSERVSPSFVGKGGFPRIMRLCVGISLGASFLLMYQRSCLRFHGVTENAREIGLDLREMTDRVKRGEPLYGKSVLSEEQQGMAARNSRYSNFFLHMVPWFNFVNHNQHGVDTAKYYRQAEQELEAERLAK